MNVLRVSLRAPACLGFALFAYLCIPPGVAATAIGDAAARMQPGMWVELPTNNMAAALANTTGSTGFDVTYTDDMVWHAATQQVFFIGSDHGYLQHFTSYDATSNAWQRLPRGYWMPAPTDYNNGMGHGYDHSAIDQARGLYYFRPFNSNNVYRYTIASRCGRNCRRRRSDPTVAMHSKSFLSWAVWSGCVAAEKFFFIANPPIRGPHSPPALPTAGPGHSPSTTRCIRLPD